MEFCPGYVGVSCVDGSCLMVQSDRNGFSVKESMRICLECWHYKGCEDCALNKTNMCTRKDAKRGK